MILKAPTPTANRKDQPNLDWLISQLKEARDEALAIPALRAEAGGTLLAAATASSKMMNMDSTPKAIATLGNQALSLFKYNSDLDDPPPGYVCEWLFETIWTTNATAPTGTYIWALWELTNSAGGAGGYTETGGATFNSAIKVTQVTPAAQDEVLLSSGWQADSNLDHNAIYAFGVNNSIAPVANSAIRFRCRLFRRWVPE